MVFRRFTKDIFTSRFNVLIFAIGAFGFLVDYVFISHNMSSLFFLFMACLVLMTCMEYICLKSRYTTFAGLVGFVSFPIILLLRIFVF